MDKQRHIQILSLLVAFIFLAFGCSRTKTQRAYEGEDLTAGEVVTVKLPIYLDAVSVDKKRMSIGSSLLRTGDLVLELAPGPHTLVVRYNDIWEVTGEYHETIKSDPATLEFVAEPGGAYLVAMKDPRDMASAQLFASDFHPWIEDAATGQKLVMPPATPDGSPAPEEERAALPVETPAEPAAPAPEETVRVNPEGGDASALEMLQFWWKRAGKEGKMGFMEWIVAAPAPGEAETDAPIKDETDVSALDMMKFWWVRAGTEERKAFMEGIVDY